MIYGTKQQQFEDYDGFVKKFEPKKTTDDCMTPPEIYDAVLDWCIAEYSLQGREIIRPFWPGVDYEMYDYPDGCVVIDNPPFSILAKIIRFFIDNKIGFFLFAPHLTLFNNYEASYVVVRGKIIYANGADVNTSFITNLESAKIHFSPTLCGKIREAQAKIKAAEKAEKGVPKKYSFPPNVLKSTDLDSYLRWGKDPVKISKQDCAIGNDLKFVFGGYFLLSQKAAIVKAQAKEYAIAVEKISKFDEQEIEVVQLGIRETEICARLGGDDS